MRLLSDFDGVWTDPAREAAAQGAAMGEELARWAARDGRPDIGSWLAAQRAHALGAPTRYGWLSDGRLSAFADEDPFVAHSALLHRVQELGRADADAAWVLDAVHRGGHADLDAFGGAMHRAGVARVEAERGPAILPDAAAAGRELLAAGVEVVVVSNSETAKLARWFGAAALPFTEHPARRAGALRLRGGARKFVLGGDPAALRLGEHAIEIGRPHYRAVLEEERPDAVVGDVFSLDLALPLALRRGAPGFERLRLFWLERSYAPAWLVRAVAAHAPEIERVGDGLAGVARRLIAAAGERP